MLCSRRLVTAASVRRLPIWTACRRQHQSRATLDRAATHTFKGVRLIAFGWGFFVVENLVMSENREFLIDRFSDRAYHTCYNCLSATACATVAIGHFIHGKQGPVWYQPTAKVPRNAAAVLSWTFLSLGLAGLSQFAPALRGFDVGSEQDDQNQRPTVATQDATKANWAKSLCPMDFEVERRYNANHSQKLNESSLFGLERITRHPSMYSFAFMSFGWALRRPFLTHFCTFAGPFLGIIILSYHKDSRFRRGIGGTLESDQDWPASSNFPFMAALFGSQKKVWTQEFWDTEMKKNNLAAAIVLASLL